MTDFGGSTSRRTFAERLLREAAARSSGATGSLSDEIAELSTQTPEFLDLVALLRPSLGQAVKASLDAVRTLLFGITGGTANIPENTIFGAKVGINVTAIEAAVDLDVAARFGVRPSSSVAYPTVMAQGFAGRFYTVHDSGDWGFVINRINGGGDAGADAFGANLTLFKTRSATGARVRVNSNDLLGRITFQGVSATGGTVNIGASIIARVTATPTSGALPTALEFYTAASGDADGGSPRLTIASSGAATFATTVTANVSVTTPLLIGDPTETRDKIRLWNDNRFTMGFDLTYTFGGLTNWAATFQTNTTAARGWWWGTDVDTNAQGAMALTHEGYLTVAAATRIGYGKNDTTSPVTSGLMLDVNGAATFNGNVVLGNATSDTITATARLISNLEPSTDNTRNLGAVALRWANVWATTFTGELVGNASTATALQTSRNFSLTGDVTAPAIAFNGTGNVALAATLADTAVTPGSYGSDTEIIAITVDSKGRVTAAAALEVNLLDPMLLMGG